MAAVNEQLACLQLGQQVPAAALLPAAVAHVLVKLADFWGSDPDVWFFQTEAEFERARITVSRTKYQYVLPRLPEAVTMSMRSLPQRIDNTTQDAYEQLKAGLLHKYGKSKWQRGFAIINHPDITGLRLATRPLALRPPYRQHAAAPALRMLILSAAEVRILFLMVFMLHGQEGPPDA